MINLCHFAITVAGVTYPAVVDRPLVFTPRTAPGSHPSFPVLLGFEPPGDPVFPTFSGPCPGWRDYLEEFDSDADATPELAWASECIRLGACFHADLRDVAEWLESRRVIVPRFAAAVGWARRCGLAPYCTPLSGVRQPDGSVICDTLESAPDGLEVEFLRQGEFIAFGDAIGSAHELDVSYIQRAIPGTFNVEVLDGPDLPRVEFLPGELGMEVWTEECLRQVAYRRQDGSGHVPEILPGMDAILVPQDGVIIDAVHAAYPDVAILVTDVTRRGKRTRLFQVR